MEKLTKIDFIFCILYLLLSIVTHKLKKMGNKQGKEGKEGKEEASAGQQWQESNSKPLNSSVVALANELNTTLAEIISSSLIFKKESPFYRFLRHWRLWRILKKSTQYQKLIKCCQVEYDISLAKHANVVTMLNYLHSKDMAALKIVMAPGYKYNSDDVIPLSITSLISCNTVSTQEGIDKAFKSAMYVQICDFAHTIIYIKFLPQRLSAMCTAIHNIKPVT